MPFVNRDGVKIHYTTAGNGPALILHHGTAGSGEDWIEMGYVNALGKNRQIILIDARGHGESDKPHDPDSYALARRAGDVVAVLDDLGLHRADYFGYSLGGWIGFGVARYAPSRIRSFVIGAAHPFAENMKAFRDLMTPEGAQTIFERIPGLSVAAKERLLANDLDALRALSFDREANAEALKSMTMPCLFFVGDNDPRCEPVKQCAAALPNAKFVAFPGHDHFTMLADIGQVGPLVDHFLTTQTVSQ
jgi:pimeloyl-ACP methyl ester carboxylesterase